MKIRITVEYLLNKNEKGIAEIIWECLEPVFIFLGNSIHRICDIISTGE